MASRHRNAAASTRPRQLWHEPLEDRRMLAILVDSVLDVVDANDGVTTLREATQQAEPGDEIRFALGDAPQTILLTEGPLNFRVDVELIGPGSDLLTIDASGNDPTPDEPLGDGTPVFDLDRLYDDTLRFGDVKSISGMTITGADSVAAIKQDSYQESLSLRDTVITGNSGAGVYHRDRNYFGSSNTISIAESTISGNAGPGVRMNSWYNTTRLVVDNSVIEANGESGFELEGVVLELTQSRISGNGAHGIDTSYRLGGISAGGYYGGTLDVQESVISGNQGDGVSVVTDENVRIADSVIDDNGGVGLLLIQLSYREGAEVIGTSISRNGDGGALVDSGAGVKIDGSVISDNVRRGTGFPAAGIAAWGGTPLVITNTTISGNTSATGSARDGAAIYAEFGDVVLDRSTVTGNAHGMAGDSPRSLTLTDTIFDQELDPTLFDSVSVDHSLIRAAGPGAIDQVGSLIGTVDNPIDPLLGPLADNGGPTHTHALLPGSPAIDAARADRLVTPTAVTSSTGPTDFFPAENLINGSGLDQTPTAENYQSLVHARSTELTGWVTDQPGALGTDYFELGPDPVLTFSFDTRLPLAQMVYWGYDLDRPHNNEARSFRFEFSSDGGETFRDVLFLGPSPAPVGVGQQTLDFGETILADTVRVTIRDNYFGVPDSDGGGRVGLGEVRFLTAEPAEVDQRGAPFARVAGGRADIGAYEAQATPTRAPGDYNADGVVDAADYTVWRDAIDAAATVPPLTGADGDGDGLVTEADKRVWRTHFGLQAPPTPTPPAGPTPLPQAETAAIDAGFAEWPAPAAGPVEAFGVPVGAAVTQGDRAAAPGPSPVTRAFDAPWFGPTQEETTDGAVAPTTRASAPLREDLLLIQPDLGGDDEPEEAIEITRADGSADARETREGAERPPRLGRWGR